MPYSFPLYLTSFGIYGIIYVWGEKFMNKIKRKCYICEVETDQGVYNVKQNYVCRACLNTYSNLYVNDFSYENGKVISKTPLEDLSEEDQRAACIQFAYTLFNQKLSKRSYPLFANYRKKGYTWIGMIRALEWFYIVKRNDLSKANNSVGIIPYVYDDAQKYYNYANGVIEGRYKSQILPKKQEESIKVEISQRKRNNLIDLGGL